MNVVKNPEALSPKDYATDQEVRWCPGCGDYAILKAMQKTMAEMRAPAHLLVGGVVLGRERLRVLNDVHVSPLACRGWPARSRKS